MSLSWSVTNSVKRVVKFVLHDIDIDSPFKSSLSISIHRVSLRVQDKAASIEESWEN